MLEVIDTYEGLLRLRHGILVKEADMPLFHQWLGYIAPYPRVGDMCMVDAREMGYDIERDVVPVMLSSLKDGFYKVEEARGNMYDCLEAIEQRFAETFGISDDIVILFYLGLCNGAGWATVYQGLPAIFLGVEKIAELDWHTCEMMTGLISHEISHVAHGMLRGRALDTPSSGLSTGIWQLYVEGFAQRFQQVLLGKEFYHQDEDGWLEWCQQNSKSSAIEYLSRLKSGKSVADFFGDWNSYLGRSDVGYFLGCEFVKSLQAQQEMDVLGIAGLSEPDIEGLAVSFLERVACSM